MKYISFYEEFSPILSNIKFNENPCSWSRVPLDRTDGLADRHDEVNNRFSQFREHTRKLRNTKLAQCCISNLTMVETQVSWGIVPRIVHSGTVWRRVVRQLYVTAASPAGKEPLARLYSTLCCTINERWIFSKSQTGGDVGVQLPS
jgi:hypothetical protein